MPNSATDTAHTGVNPTLAVPLDRLIRKRVQACPPSTPVRLALETMRRMSIGSVIVSDDADRPIGILTLRDVLDRIVLETDILNAPIARVMTHTPVTLDGTASAYDAAVLMVRRGVRHIVVVGAGGRLTGVVSERDLFGMQTTGVRHLSTAIKGASDIAAVESFGREIQVIARQMLLQGMSVGPLTAFISSLIDLLTERIVNLEFESAGVDVPACWLVMGSEGRREQTLLTDQDNGIVFDDPSNRSADTVRSLLTPIARRINESLDRAGYRLCTGDIMACNPRWCLSLAEWRDRFGRWIDSGSPHALLHGSIFFDLRPLTGTVALGGALRTWLVHHAAKNRRFLHQMTMNALRNRPALGWLHRFATRADGTIDLKINACGPIVDAARILSLGCALDEVRTEARLRGAADSLNLRDKEVEAWIAAFYQIQGFRLQTQARRLDANEEPSNRIAPLGLHDFDQQVLRLALEQARTVQRRLALDYGI